MRLLEDLKHDIDIGRRTEQSRIEEKKRREIEYKKRHPVVKRPNKWLLKIGILIEKTKPVWPAPRWIKKNIGVVWRYAEADASKAWKKIKGKIHVR